MNRPIVLYLALSLLSPVWTALAANNEALLDALKDDAGWERESLDDSELTLGRKDLDGYDLQALEVSAVSDLSPGQVLDVIEDVAAYNDILTSSAMECELLSESATRIIGYQFYRVPLLSDRCAVFEMRPRQSTADGGFESDWVLLAETAYDDLSLPDAYEADEPSPIEIGAGTWQFDPLPDGRWTVAYRLQMDPGGWMPDFLLERVNRKGITGLFEDVMRAAAARAGVDTTLTGALP